MSARPQVEPDAGRLSEDAPVLRPASTADLDALTRLEAASFTGDRLSRRSLRRLLRAASAVTIVSVASGGLVGYALVLFRKGAKVARLYSLARDTTWRGRGIGAALLDAAEAESRARGAREIRLEVRVDNAAARTLYHRHGYAEAGIHEAYYEDGTDAVRMHKRLSDPAR